MHKLLCILAFALLYGCQIKCSSEISVTFTNSTSDTLTVRCSSLVLPSENPQNREREYILAPNAFIDVLQNVQSSNGRKTCDQYETHCSSIFQSIVAFRNNDPNRVIEGCQANIIEITSIKDYQADLNLVFTDEDF